MSSIAWLAIYVCTKLSSYVWVALSDCTKLSTSVQFTVQLQVFSSTQINRYLGLQRMQKTFRLQEKINVQKLWTRHFGIIMCLQLMSNYIGVVSITSLEFEVKQSFKVEICAFH